MNRSVHILKGKGMDFDAHFKYMFNKKGNGSSDFSFSDDKIGKVNYNERYINGLIVTAWSGTANEESRLTAESSMNMFAMHFMMRGKVLNSPNGIKSHEIVEDTNNLWTTPSGNSGSITIPAKKYIETFGVVFKDEYFESLTNRYPDLLSDIRNIHIKNRPHKYFSGTNITTIELNLIINQIKNSFLMGNYSSMYVEAKIMELLSFQLSNLADYKCYDCVGKNCVHRTEKDRVFEVKSIIDNDFITPPSVYELSRMVGVNEKTMREGFKKEFNQTIYNYIVSLRMNKASHLLRDTNLSMNEIAVDCGYEYASHFSTAFKRKFGKTPLSFRFEMV